MHNVSSKGKCTNCGACLNCCPVDAISIDSSKLYYEIQIDEDRCTKCGKCFKVCPLNQEFENIKVISAWYGKHKDKSIVMSSSSGGAFTSMADTILADGGIVFSACYSNDNKVEIKSSDEKRIDDMKKSKYVESLTGFGFRAIREELEKGRKVLLCATPCQIAGLKCYLGNDYSNLYTCDFTCGGLPSHYIYQNYIEMLENKYKSRVKSVDFRPKTFGWDIHAIEIVFENGKKYISPAVLDPFFSGFIVKHVNTRDYCYDCKFAEQHMSDITLADFWKCRQLTGQKNPKDGVSLILVNSNKGEELIHAVQGKMELKSIDKEEASYNLKRRTYSEEYMKIREQYLNVFKTKGIFAAAEYLGVPVREIKKHIVMLKYWLKGLLLLIR